MKPTLNGGESRLRFPSSLSELQSAGLCQHCLEAAYTRPVTLESLTIEEIDEVLSTLEEEK